MLLGMDHVLFTMVVQLFAQQLLVASAVVQVWGHLGLFLLL
jgi:hypothetical protein